MLKFAQTQIKENKIFVDGRGILATKYSEVNWHFIIYAKSEYGHSFQLYNSKLGGFFMVIILIDQTLDVNQLVEN